MVEPQASLFWRAALQSGLADDLTLRPCWDAIPEAKRTVDAIDRRLARQAVNAGLVTVWQAQQLLAGRAAGFRIDRYILLDLIGQGGMGRVYLARDTRLGRKVAIKVLSKERMNNPRALARFQREAKVGAQLQHENLVRMYDEGESAGIHYLVMEFIDGKNIAQLIGEQGAIPWPAAARLARQVALGLEHAHKKGLIHRDVNPSNILVTHDGTAKLTDLGLAIDLADEANVTRDGATVGTFDYISPEQAKHSREVDTRSDIYSLGCSLYHMISGRVPFPMPSLPEKLYAHQLHEATPLDEAVSDVPTGLARVVRTMMRKDPSDRYQTPQSVAQALEAFVDEEATVATVVGPSSGSVTIEAKTRVAAAVRAAPTEAPPPPPPPPAGPPLTEDPDLSFPVVDVGPDASLTEGLASGRRPKSRSGVRRGGEESAGPAARGGGPGSSKAGPRWRPGLGPEAARWLPAALGVAIVLGAVLAIAAMVWLSRQRLSKGEAGAGPAPGDSARPPAGAGKAGPGRGPAILVVGRDGSRRPAADLAEAVAIALGASGEVVLDPTGPLRLPATEIRVTRGSLTIRAAEGASPVLAVDVAGRSLLVGTAGTSIALKGLRVVAYFQPSERPVALIDSGGAVGIDHCSLVAAGSTGGARAVRAQGMRLEVESSLIAGFDRALEVDVFPGSEVAIRRSILARTGGADWGSGWPLKVNYGGSRQEKPGGKGLGVTLERATIQGAGALEVAGFAPESPLAVEADRCLFQARSLVAFAPRQGESPELWPKGLAWSGRGNRYDIAGTAWVVLSADGELPTPNTPADLEAWKAAVNSDRDSASGSFRLGPAGAAPDPSASAPADFAPAGEGLDGVGADPGRVGPRPPGSP